MFMSRFTRTDYHAEQIFIPHRSLSFPRDIDTKRFVYDCKRAVLKVLLEGYSIKFAVTFYKYLADLGKKVRFPTFHWGFHY